MATPTALRTPQPDPSLAEEGMAGRHLDGPPSTSYPSPSVSPRSVYSSEFSSLSSVGSGGCEQIQVQSPSDTKPEGDSSSSRRGGWWHTACPWNRSIWILVAILALSMVGSLVGDIMKHAKGRARARVNSSKFGRAMNGDVIFLNSADNATALYESYYRMADSGERPRAALVFLARNEDVEDVLKSMVQLEARFNHKYNYPYVFLNNDPFDENFKFQTSNVTAGQTSYGLIAEEHWGYPKWISKNRAARARREMQRTGVLYGSRESYHHMCRYYSGFFARHPLLAEYDYYWRVEPDVHFLCDVDYDPFVFMREKGIKYGFAITVLESPNTIPTLWQTTRRFVNQNPSLIPKSNLLDFVTAPDGDFNMCHFWSNFELGDLNFWRTEAYQRYFEHLDKAGGFFYERWGDAPVHSLAAAMFLNASQVHHFSDIGYRHNSMMNCPAKMRNRCDCDAANSVDFHTPGNSFGRCHRLWEEATTGGATQ